MKCSFCRIKDIEKELVVAESRKSIAFMCIEPLCEGHLLVIPKRHVKEMEELRRDELYDLVRLLVKADRMLGKTYNAKASFTFMKRGTAKSKEHLHIHLLPGFVPIREALKSHGFSSKARDRKSVGELAKVASKIKTSV